MLQFFFIIFGILFYLSIVNITRMEKAGFIIFILLIFSITVFSRKSFVRQYNLFPTYSELFKVDWDSHGKYILAEYFDNILLFIPVGYLAKKVFRNFKVWHVIGICFFLSFAIEIAQFLLAVGVCEVNDIIHNAIGGLLGYVIRVKCSKRIP